MRGIRQTLGALALLGLVACGGTGSLEGPAMPGSPPAPSAPPTSGASVHPLAGSWTDTNGRGQLFVSPDGEVYSLLRGTDTTRLLRGTLTASNGLVPSGSFDVVDMQVPGAIEHWSVSGSYQPQSQLLLSADGRGPLLSDVYDAHSHGVSAVAALAGRYEVTIFGNAPSVISYLATLSEDGGVDLVGWQAGQEQCHIRGALTAASPTITVLNASLVASGAGCQFPDGTNVKGLAQYDPDNNVLILFGMSESGDVALLLYASPINA